jgi:hypothetical protein
LFNSPGTACWDWALSPAGLIVLAIAFLAPLALRRVWHRPMPMVEAVLIGFLAVFILMGGCKVLVLSG